jgi:6-pyruvoyltetrahydropterin/6-carboxytetrahydropterin synthase
MYTARIEAGFAAAHFLSHYHGKCENLHGHNYQVRLHLRGKTLDAGGMLADFGLLKRCLKDVLIPLDHHNLNDMDVFEQDPSAERIARYIFEQVEKKLPGFGIKPELLWAIDIFETPVNMARYER